MLPELKLNDVVVAENLRVFYCKSLKNDPHSYPLFATSKDKYQSLFQLPEEYFKHRVSYDNVGAQFITDNFDLVLRQGSTLNGRSNKSYANFHHYAKDINSEVSIQDRVNVAVCNNEKVLLIKNLISEQCKELYDKTIRLHEVLQWSNDTHTLIYLYFQYISMEYKDIIYQIKM